MGWNAGYRIFESTVINIYNQGKLDKEMLSLLMELYRGTDIDSGGSQDLVANDGKMLEQIVIETFGLTMPEKPNEECLDDYYDEVYDLMQSITDRFGWC